MAAYQSPKLLVGVRVPGGMPNFTIAIYIGLLYNYIFGCVDAMACASPDCKSGALVLNTVGSTPTTPTKYAPVVER